MNAQHASEAALVFVLIQLIIMIGAARALNTLFRWLGQPGVIGEIMAGLILGPSLFGHLFPAASIAVFGAHPAPAISAISQIGLTLLMFQIGMDFEFGLLKAGRNRRAVGIIAAASVATPLLLGLGVGWLSAPTLAPGRDPLPYALFCAVAMAITAVPILGRILRQFDLSRTRIGVVAISAAAINDLVGWLLLAAVSAFAASRLTGLSLALQWGGLIALGLALRYALAPLAAWMVRVFPLKQGELAPNMMAAVLVLVLGLAICTARLGVFAIFGGFAAGLLFHAHGAFVAAWRRQVGQFVLVFFLPVFFTFTGLRTNVLGLTGADDLVWLGVILAAAVLGKIVPVYLAGRLNGFDRDESAILAALMNTRALMELIVLNVGYDLGVLPQKVFTMLVIMAVATTIMTGPLLKLLLPRTGHVIPVGVEA
ncbi:cation:proton antiporter [Phenylobacterium aquaticum]|uniref:cation:proton antiporter n=1 Tax=Phenylobacterium aquaticum TaxID=1763816 RepID=UPI0026ED11C8|nr:cation:proton antiporter [Phenylobacterium aquaticum]